MVDPQKADLMADILTGISIVGFEEYMKNQYGCIVLIKKY